VLRAAVGIGSVVAVSLCAFAAPALASYTATPSAGGVLMAGDGASDALTITITPTVLEHDRFGVDPGFASAQDFDTTQAGTQSLPSSFATLLTVDGGTGNDSLKLVDGRPGNAVNWLHRGPGTGCVGELVGDTYEPALCYHPDTIDSMTLDGGDGNDSISSLDAFANTPLTLIGGDGDDSLSQDGPDSVHAPIAPATLIGGPGRDAAALSEDQSGSNDYTVGNGTIQGAGYGPVHYDDTDELVIVYTRLGPDNHVTITEQGDHAINVWSAGGTVDASKAGPQTSVIARTSLFDLGGDQGAINFKGGPGDDVFFGTDLNDRASGGGGADQLDGEGGKDRISARDGERDIVNCGKGRDRAKTDKHEASVKGCEVVKKPHH
jgi:Ca2+-binding RTX toxin-like protein